MHRMQFSLVRTNWWKKDAASTLTDAMQDIDNLTTWGSGSQLCSASLYDAHGNGGGGFRSKFCARQAHGDAQIEAMHMMVATVVGDAVLMIPDRSGSWKPDRRKPTTTAQPGLSFCSWKVVNFILLLNLGHFVAAFSRSNLSCHPSVSSDSSQAWEMGVSSAFYVAHCTSHSRSTVFFCPEGKWEQNHLCRHHCRTYVCHWYQIHVSTDWKIGSGDFQFCILGNHSQKSKRLLENTDCHAYCTLAFTTLQTFQISAQIVIVYLCFDILHLINLNWL